MKKDKQNKLVLEHRFSYSNREEADYVWLIKQRCHPEFCVTVYNEKVLNSVQTGLPDFSAMYHYTKYDMASGSLALLVG